MSQLRLEELSASTIVHVNSLGLKPGQEQFVSPVSYAAAAAVTPMHTAWQRVVLEDDRVVGFIHGNFDPEALQEEFKAALWRINVDADAQGKGVGRFAVEALLEEAAVLMRDNKIEILPVVEDGALVGVITESDLLDSFIDIMGFRDPGTRLTIEAKDQPGVLATLTGITANHHANIQHLAVHRGLLDTSVVIVGVNTPNTEAIEADLEAAGMHVLGRLVNG